MSNDLPKVTWLVSGRARKPCSRACQEEPRRTREPGEGSLNEEKQAQSVAQSIPGRKHKLKELWQWNPAAGVVRG